MKILYYSNLLFYIATLIAYTFYELALGLLFQFFLGIMQLLYFLVCRARDTSENIEEHLKNYKLLVVFMFIIGVILMGIQPSSNTITRSIIIVLPMLIATYFVYITYLIQKK